MRAPAGLLALLLLVGSPSAFGAGYTLGVERTAEATVAPGDAREFSFPLVVDQDGEIYAKLLPSRSNAVHDGVDPNGTLSSGWRVSFALTGDDGLRLALGTRFDGEPTDLVPVTRGENATLHVTVHLPDDPTIAGSTQKVFVALAYRSPGGGAGASGGIQDEARALTMLLHIPAAAAPPTPTPTDPTPASPTPTVPPVSPLPASSDTYVTVEQQAPDWFFVGVLVFLAVLAGCAIVLTRARLVRDAAEARAAERGRSVTILARDEERVEEARAEASRAERQGR